ncbi:MAG: hypothetical protein NTW79_02830, partial [Candidatus Berkelbacteria bacterium]|nr:hypothetical protein [Candidatus Berkelbacteria bacterium]
MLVVFLVSFCVLPKFIPKNKTKINAASGSATITSKAEWELGTVQNIDSTSTPGDIKIDDKTSGSQHLDTAGISLDADYDSADKAKVVDDDLATYWGPIPSNGANHYWEIGPFDAINLNKYHLDGEYYTGLNIYTSSNGSSWTKINPTTLLCAPSARCSADHTVSPSVVTKYYKIVTLGGAPYDSPFKIYDLKLYYQQATATHTSSSTQLDGTATFQHWDTFVPDATIPANTSVAFRFRTSADSSNWSNWSNSAAYAGSIDLSGLTQQRYLQVETTLTSTDSIATPS